MTWGAAATAGRRPLLPHCRTTSSSSTCLQRADDSHSSDVFNDPWSYVAPSEFPPSLAPQLSPKLVLPTHWLPSLASESQARMVATLTTRHPNHEQLPSRAYKGHALLPMSASQHSRATGLLLSDLTFSSLSLGPRSRTHRCRRRARCVLHPEYFPRLPLAPSTIDAWGFAALNHAERVQAHRMHVNWIQRDSSPACECRDDGRARLASRVVYTSRAMGVFQVLLKRTVAPNPPRVAHRAIDTGWACHRAQARSRSRRHCRRLADSSPGIQHADHYLAQRAFNNQTECALRGLASSSPRASRPRLPFRGCSSMDATGCPCAQMCVLHGYQPRLRRRWWTLWSPYRPS